MRKTIRQICSATLAFALAMSTIGGIQASQAASFFSEEQLNLSEHSGNLPLTATPSDAEERMATPSNTWQKAVELPEPADQWLLDSVTEKGEFENTGSIGTKPAVLIGTNAGIITQDGKSVVHLYGKSGTTKEEDGYIKLPVTLSGTINDVFTISFWMKPEDNFTHHNLDMMNTVLLQGGRTMLNFIKSGSTNTEMVMRSPFAGASDLSAKAEVGKWQQVIFVRNTSNETVTIYINGSRALHKTGIKADKKDMTDSINIGRHMKDLQMNGHYQGYISTVNHYTEALNEEEAAALYEEEAGYFDTQEMELVIDGENFFTVAGTGGTIEFGITAQNIEDGETVAIAFKDRDGQLIENDNLTAKADALLSGRTTIRVSVAADLPDGEYTGTVSYETAAAQFTIQKIMSDNRVYTFEKEENNRLFNREGTAEVGILEEGAKLVPSDLDGNALFLDGTGYAVITEKINFTQTPVTLSMWIKPDESSFDVQVFTAARTLLHQKVSATAGRSILALRNNPEGAITSYMGGQNVNGAEEQLVIPGKWNQVAVALEPVNKRYRFFLNGRKVGEGDLGGSVVGGASDILIGKHREEGNNLQFVGLVDNLTFSNAYLDERVIMERYLEDMPLQLLQDQLLDLAYSWSQMREETLAETWVRLIDEIIENEVPATQEGDAEKTDCLNVWNKLSPAMEFYEAMKELRDDVVQQKKYLEQMEKALAGAEEKPKTEMEALNAEIVAAESLIANVTLDHVLADIEAAKNALRKARKDLENKLSLGVVNVYSNEPVNTFRRELLGANHRFSTSNTNNPVAINGYGSWDYMNDRVYPQIKQYLSEIRLSSIRFPGGTCANLYNWKRGIGPQENRIPAIHGNALIGVPSEFGVDEVARMCEEAGSEMVYVYNFANGSIQDALDLIEYLNAPNDGSNLGGGTDWAAVRASNGHPEPYHVTKFEIGNEFYLTPQMYWTIGEGYQQRYANGGRVEFQSDYKSIASDKHKLSPYQPVEVTDWTPAASIATGEANLVRYFRYKPVEEGSAHVFVNDEEWKIVNSLEGQGDVKVCTVDYTTGAIAFGDGIDGAIPEKGAVLRTKYTTIQPGFKDYGREMKAFGESLGIDIEVYSALHDAAFYSAMSDDNDCWDGSAYHPYGNAGSNTGIAYHNAAMVSADRQVMSVRSNLNTLRKYKPDGKLCITEYGILGSSSNYKKWLNSTGHGLYLVRSVMGFSEIEGVSYADRHSLLDTPGAVDSVGVGQMGILSCYESEDLKHVEGFTATPAALILGMFSKFYGNTIVKTDTAGIPMITAGDANITGLAIQATVDEEGYTYVAVGNCMQSDAPLFLTFDKPSVLPTAEIQMVVSPEYNSVNDLSNPNRIRKEHEEVNGILGEDSFLYTFPANSFVIIKLKTGDQLLEETEVGSVKIKGTSETEEGVRLALEAEVFPENAFTRQVSWRIAKGKDVAEIDEETGHVRTLSSGKFTVVAACAGVDSDPFEITVHSEYEIPIPPTEYTVTLTAGANGTIDPSGEQTVREGDSLSFSVNADEGYEIAEVVVDGKKVTVDGDGSYTIADIQKNLEVRAEFQKKVQIETEYTVTLISGANGTINPSGSQKVKEGDSLSFSVSANAGYEIVCVIVDGEAVAVDANGSYTITDIRKDMEVRAEFQKEVPAETEYIVTLIPGANGTIDPAGERKVKKGESLRFTVSADEGYEIAEVTVDGEVISVDAGGGYVIMDIQKNLMVKAMFEKTANTGNEDADSSEESSYEDSSVWSGALDGVWQKDTRGWRYKQTNGIYSRNRWGKIKGVWYYFDNEGYMAVGWQYIDGKWYYLNTEEIGLGAMITGWFFDNQYGRWFYLAADGAMYTGWQQIDGNWYYFNPISDGTRGAMAADVTIDGYYVDENGVRQ